MKMRLLIGSAAALALAACGPSEEETMTEDVAAGQTTEAMEQKQAAGQAAQPQRFATEMAASDMYEIEAGKLARERGKDQAIKDFGRMMVEDHTRSSEQLKQAAARAKPAVTVNASMTPQQTADLEALRNAGDNFDSVYKLQQIAAHEQALAKLRAHATGDGPFRAFANQTATAVEGHLERARQLPGG